MKMKCYTTGNSYNMNITSENAEETELLEQCGAVTVVHNWGDRERYKQLVMLNITADNYDTKVIDTGIPGVPPTYEAFKQETDKQEEKREARYRAEHSARAEPQSTQQKL